MGKKIIERLPSIKKLKNEADRKFSLVIRLRDSDENGYGRCITCGVKKFYRNADCGHFQSRGDSATRFDMKNCALQCKTCNGFKDGRQYIFGKRIDELYGAGTADGLEQRSHMECKRSREDYIKMIWEFDTILKKPENKRRLTLRENIG